MHANVQGDLQSFSPDSPEQQDRVLAVADSDAFNWGYDPVHWGVPEGSYASEPNGEARILEFRRMVQAIHGMGLRLVLDVVYNHTFHSGLDGMNFPSSFAPRVSREPHTALPEKKSLPFSINTPSSGYVDRCRPYSCEGWRIQASAAQRRV